MKNKNSILLLLKIICVVLVLILILLVLFLYKYITSKPTKHKVTYKTIVKRYDIDKYKKLEFDFKNYEVLYTTTNSNKLIVSQTGKVEKMYIDKEFDKNKLSIKESVSNIFDKKKYRIYIPSSYEGDISIINGFYNISVNNLNTVNINNNSGNINIKHVDTLYLKNVSGNINIRGKITNISGSSSTGNIIIDEVVNSSNIETITGDIIIKKFLVNSKSNLETTSGNIDVKIKSNSDCKLIIKSNSEYDVTKNKCLNGNNKLNVKNVTGNITIK